MSNTVRVVLILLLIALIFIFLLPITAGVFHIGMIYPTAIFSVLLFALLCPAQVNALMNSRLRFLCILVCIGMAAISLLSVVTCGFMIHAANKRTTESDATVIVLGCQVRGDTPSRMLYDRMNAALEFLNENPDSVVIASGGQGPGENISEAQAISDYLIQNGIDKNRIYLEDKSTTTYENLHNAASIIKEENLSKSVAIASDNFHQLRAQIFAKRNGLDPSSCGCGTYPVVCAGYWTREVLAVVKALALGY